MLQSIRDRTQGWVAGVIISLVILSFALWGVHSYLQSAGNSDVIAKVNNTDITRQQLVAAYTPLRNQAQANTESGYLSENIESSLKRRALDALITIQVLRQASIAEKYKISDRQVETYLERLQDFQVNGVFSLERFQQVLANNRISVGEFLKYIRTSLLIDQPKAGIVLSSFVLPNEVTDTIALINQQRDIAYVNLPSTSLLTDAINVTDAEISDYYKQQKDEFKTPERVSIEYLELSPTDVASRIPAPTTEALKAYYNDNINTYTLPMQWKLNRILIPVAEKTTETDIQAAIQKSTAIKEKVTKGADFALLMAQYPAGDQVSGWVTLNQVPAELQKAVAGLTQKNQVSDVIKVDKGLMLVQVADVKDSQVLPFEQVKDSVADAIRKQKSQEKYAELKEKLANLTYEHPETLKSAASALGLKIKASQPFAQDKAGSDISSNKIIRDVAFSQDVLNSQNNSDVIQLTPDRAVVIRVKSHTPAALLSLQAVRQQIVARLKAKKAEQKAQALANEIKKKLENGTSLDSIAQQYHITWTKLGQIARNSTKADPTIVYSAFNMPRPQSSSQTSYASVKTATGYAVIVLNAVREGTIDPKAQDQYDMFANQVQNTQGLLEYKLYEKSLENKANVKIYGDLQG